MYFIIKNKLKLNIFAYIFHIASKRKYTLYSITKLSIGWSGLRHWDTRGRYNTHFSAQTARKLHFGSEVETAARLHHACSSETRQKMAMLGFTSAPSAVALAGIIRTEILMSEPPAKLIKIHFKSQQGRSDEQDSGCHLAVCIFILKQRLL